MGLYINQNSKNEMLPASAAGKIETLINDGAVPDVDAGKIFKENLVCVVDNGSFGATAYAYDDTERNRFTYFDGRPRVWLIYPHVKELAR